MMRCSCHGLHGWVPTAASATHLDLRGDQLADEVFFERCSLGRGLELLEAVRERERLGVEDGELLFDGEREVGAVLVRLARGADLLFRGELLRTHGGRHFNW